MNNLFDFDSIVNDGKEVLFATFDWDGTCITNDVAEATLAYICEHGLLKNTNLLSDIGETKNYHERVFQEYYRLLKEDIFRAYLFAARIFAGFTLEGAEKIVKDAIIAEGEKLGKRELFNITIARGLAVRPQVKKLAESLIHRKVAIWIISASSEIAVSVAMRHFGYKGELIGLRNTIVDSVLTDTIVEPYSIREGKVDCIKKYVSPSQQPVLAIGDSMNDIPMIEYSHTPVVVDCDNALVDLAGDRGWHIIPTA